MIPRTLFAVVVLLAASLLVVAANNVLSAKQAREILRKLGGATLKPDQVRIKTISNGLGSDNAIVEAQIETAVRFKQEKGEWQVADIRLGDQHWESVELITEAVRREKTRRTELQMQKIVAALAAYKQARGNYLVAENFAQMIEALSPAYLMPPVQFDLWEQPLLYRGTATGYKLSSAGADLKPNTNDDLVIEK